MHRLFVPIAMCLIWAADLLAGDGPRTDLVGEPLPAGVSTRLGTTRLRHTNTIHATAWMPNGKLLASGCTDKIIRLWDPATGKEVRHLKCDSYCTSLLILGDGKTLVSGDAQGGIRLWDIETGRELRRLGSNKFRVTYLAVSPDNSTVFAANWDRSVRQYLVADGTELKVFSVPQGKVPVQQGKILAISLSPDGKQLFTAADDGVARFFDIASGRETRKFAIESPGLDIGSAAFSRDGLMLASTRSDGVICLYELRDGKLLRSFGPAALGPIATRPSALDFSPNGKWIAATSFVGVRVYDTASGQETRVFPTPAAGQGVIAFAPDGQTLAAAADQALRLWHVADGREALSLPGHFAGVHSIAFSRDGTLVITASRDRTVRVWDRMTGKEIAQFDPKAPQVTHVSVGIGPRSFFTAGFYGLVEFRLKGDNQIAEVNKWDQLKWATNIATSPDGMIAALSGSDLPVLLVDTASGQILAKLGESKDAAKVKPPPSNSSLTFSRDGKLLATLTGNAPIQVWNVATGRLVRQIQRKGSQVHFAFSPDNKLLAVGNEDITLYEIASGQVRQQIGKTLGLRALAFSSAGRHLLAGLFLNGVQCYEVSTGSLVAQRGDTAGQMHAVAISPDGDMLACARPDTSVSLWVKPPWPEKTRPVAPVQLNPAEVEKLWKSLAELDGRRAHQTIWTLVGASEKSVPFLRGKLKPADSITPRQVEQYVRDLDSPIFEIRSKATRELAILGDQAENALHAARKGSPSLEFDRRLEGILARIKDAPPEKLQALRALEVLEYAASDEARQVLALLVEGGAGHWLTDSARQAMQRLRSVP